MNKPRKIITFNRFYLPGYRAGGPIRSLVNMVDRLSGDFEFYIVTTDRDIGESVPYPNIIRDGWDRVGKANVRYLSLSDVNIRIVRDIVFSVRPDIIYLNSFFDPCFTQRVLWLRHLGFFNDIPIVLAPRGEFSEGALQLKFIKKKFYLLISTMLRLYRGVTWQASSEYERSDIISSLACVEANDVKIAMNVPPITEGVFRRVFDRIQGTPLRICFLSRISPKKNLDFALRTLMLVKSDVVFTIYGPKEDSAYWSRCEDLISTLPPNISVKYAGEVQPSDVKRVLQLHHVFFFPSRGENYGHVIHEALGSGLPVLISDKTPWRDVVQRGVGWVFPLDRENSFADIIDEVALWGLDKHENVGRRAIEFHVERSVDSDVIDANKRLFSDLLK